MKKATPEGFVKQAEDLVKKYNKRESDKPDGKSTGDKPASTPKPAGKLVELTVRVVEYKGDMMHSSAMGKGGAIFHPDAFDAAVCEILSPPLYAGQKLQICGWNRQTMVDPGLRQKGNVVRLTCDPQKRRDPPWKSAPKGFGQWEVQLSKVPASGQ